MARAPQVEFPGKKRQKVRMRGSKHANQDTQQKIKRSLAKLLENPEDTVPKMVGKLPRGIRKHPLQRSFDEIAKVNAKKNNVAWLAKKMVSRNSDHLSKAWAGSLHAAHDEEFQMVQQFKSAAFGKASFIRRGDGNQGYQAGIQNHSHITLRLLPWEDHAKRGIFFFSWKDGFVCTGIDPTPPEGWLEDVLERSRFEFTMKEIDGVKVFSTEDVDPEKIHSSEFDEVGYLRLEFNHGHIVGIGFDKLSTAKEKDKAFVHHLALSMLPPILPRVLKMTARYAPKGWEDDVPQEGQDAVAKALDAFQGLVLNEGHLAAAIIGGVQNSIDRGVMIDGVWNSGEDTESLFEFLSEMNGSFDERTMAAAMLNEAVSEGKSAFLNSRGEVSERDAPGIVLNAKASLGNVLAMLWEDNGMTGLSALGIEGEEAENIWKAQQDKPKAFGEFIKKLDSERESARKKAAFPYKSGELGGACGLINDLVIHGLLEGMGKAERLATKRQDTLDLSAGAWAWLVAANRSQGQDWHFDSKARDKAGVWTPLVSKMLASGKEICDNPEKDSEHVTAYKDAIQELHKLCGQGEL